MLFRSEEVGESAEGILLELAHALEQLEKEGWGSSLPIEQVGGDIFRFDFHPEFTFEYRRETERDAVKQPVRVHLYLMTLLRR